MEVNDDDVLIATPMELVATFRRALVALADPAESIGMSWREESEHPEWERLAARVFDAFVRQPIAASVDHRGGDFPLAKYDIDFDDYGSLSWLAIAGDGDKTRAFVRFVSGSQPFDAMHLREVAQRTGEVGKRLTVSWPTPDLVYVRRSAGGSVDRIERIASDE